MAFRITADMIPAPYTFNSAKAVVDYPLVVQNYSRIGECNALHGVFDGEGVFFLEKRDQFTVTDPTLKAELNQIHLDFKTLKWKNCNFSPELIDKIQKKTSGETIQIGELVEISEVAAYQLLQQALQAITAKFDGNETKTSSPTSRKPADGTYNFSIVEDFKKSGQLQLRLGTNSHFYIANGQKAAFISGEIIAKKGVITSISTNSGAFYLIPGQKMPDGRVLTAEDILQSHLAACTNVGIPQDVFFKCYKKYSSSFDPALEKLKSKYKDLMSREAKAELSPPSGFHRKRPSDIDISRIDDDMKKLEELVDLKILSPANYCETPAPRNRSRPFSSFETTLSVFGARTINIDIPDAGNGLDAVRLEV